MKKLVFALAVAVVVAGLSQAAPVAKPVVSAVKVPDVQVERNIRAKFAKSKINAEHFTVTVQGGVATIEGKTNVIQHKGVATRLAKTGGAVSVKNHILVSEEAKAKAAARLGNGTVETQMARATVNQPGGAQTVANQAKPK